jgi:ABC-type bacteriocin/lantibiotic exporter with double-glycine peptidase domain
MRASSLFATLLPSRPEDNVPATLYALVRAMGVRVTKTGVWEALREHPDSASLLGMSDALRAWQIENTSLQLASVEQFGELPTPFIAHLHEQKGWFALVSTVQAGYLTWFDTAKGWRTESLDSFGKRWSGAVLLAETNENSGEEEYQQNRAKERLQTARQFLLVAGGLLLFTFGLLRVATYATPAVWGLALTKLLGTVTSLLLLNVNYG